VYIIAGDNARAYEVNNSNLNTVTYAPEIIIITVAGPINVDTIKAPERSRLINITGISSLPALHYLQAMFFIKI
jgi:hypothetical protein